ASEPCVLELDVGRVGTFVGAIFAVSNQGAWVPGIPGVGPPSPALAPGREDLRPVEGGSHLPHELIPILGNQAGGEAVDTRLDAERSAGRVRVDGFLDICTGTDRH